jgi:hypothetical protein
MTRTQLFVTLSLVICATAPCADGMAAAPQSAPLVPDSWWFAADQVRSTLATSSDTTLARVVMSVMTTVVLAWRYGWFPGTRGGGRQQRRGRGSASLRTVIGGLPPSGVMSGALAEPGLPPPVQVRSRQTSAQISPGPDPHTAALDPSGTGRYAACPDARPVCHG